MELVSQRLDNIAEFLEAKGMFKEAKELDSVANAIDTPDVAAEKALKSFIEEGKPLRFCYFRIGTPSWSSFFCQARDMLKRGSLNDLDDQDEFILKSMETGKKAIHFEDDLKTASKQRAKHQGSSVVLDSPSRTPSGDKKKFQVYVNSGRKDKDGRIIAKKIKWGDPDMQVRNFDDKARKSFLKRHQCSSKTDKKTPGWWACNVHLFAKQLNLSSTKPW